jgi:hypothetical protein
VHGSDVRDEVAEEQRQRECEREHREFQDRSHGASGAAGAPP